MNTGVTSTAGCSLTVSDRCDRCSARAVVETMTLNGGSLHWCSHHYGVSEVALLNAGGTIVVDNRAT
jgi:hypothetical protein